MTRLGAQANLALLAWQFLTRVPLPVTPAWTPRRMAAAARYFPLVGALIGAAAAAVLLASAAVLPATVAVMLSLAATLLLTGAFHEDGLADSFDGLGAATPGRALEIMRDSRLGTFGAAALGLALAIKVATLAALAPPVAAAALVAGHAASRASAVLVIATSGYVRPTGTAAFAAGRLDRRSAAIALGLGVASLLALTAFGAGAGAAGLLGLALGHLAARASFERRLRGYTGDTLGATQQLSELGLYLGLAAWA